MTLRPMQTAVGPFAAVAHHYSPQSQRRAKIQVIKTGAMAAVSSMASNFCIVEGRHRKRHAEKLLYISSLHELNVHLG